MDETDSDSEPPNSGDSPLRDSNGSVLIVDCRDHGPQLIRPTDPSLIITGGWPVSAVFVRCAECIAEEADYDDEEDEVEP